MIIRQSVYVPSLHPAYPKARARRRRSPARVRYHTDQGKPVPQGDDLSVGTVDDRASAAALGQAVTTAARPPSARRSPPPRDRSTPQLTARFHAALLRCVGGASIHR
eukprot:358772-Chlamydomonas_euryale.AAC.11